MKISNLRALSGWIEKYKLALRKKFFLGKFICVRLVIVSLAINIVKLQSLVSEGNFFNIRIIDIAIITFDNH